jgi:hypothetical protein
MKKLAILLEIVGLYVLEVAFGVPLEQKDPAPADRAGLITRRQVGAGLPL